MHDRRFASPLLSGSRSPLLGSLFSLSLVACGANEATPSGDAQAPSVDAGTQARDLPCDVDALLKSRCQSCHAATPLYGAPMPLVTHADLHATAPSNPAKKVFDLVGARIHDDGDPMPQAPKARLDAKESKVIDDWVLAGAPLAVSPSMPGSCEGGGGNDGGVVAPEACTPNIEVKPAAAWTMPKATQDEYVCYGFDVESAKKLHITAISPNVVNAKIVHHALLFQSDTAYSTTPKVCDSGTSLRWRLVYGWAPGGQTMVLPPEAGFPVEGKSHYVVQLHYSNLTGLEGEKDTSGFKYCTTENLRPNDADVLAFGTHAFKIPERGALDISCDFEIPASLKNLHVFAAMPHMHQLGKAIATTHVPQKGAPVGIGAQPAWDFNNQVWMPVSSVVTGGDTVRTRCRWQNPGGSSVGFGERTSDEMCYSFTAYYPKVQSSVWSWALPAEQSSCVPTPQ